MELTPHQLRHTFARQRVEAGLPLASLGKLLGHAQLETTQRYTAGADPALYQVYQTTMPRLTSAANGTGAAPAPPVSPTPPPTPPALPAPAAAVVPPPLPPAALRPLVPPPLPDWETWASHLPQPLRQVGLAYVQRRLPNWSPLRQRIQALKYLGRKASSVSGIGTWLAAPSANRPTCA
ncbi:MAG: site-specific integrase [Anaerolineales bacterium]|nr:site-specific integrase [Anaerolineales bacterium]